MQDAAKVVVAVVFAVLVGSPGVPGHANSPGAGSAEPRGAGQSRFGGDDAGFEVWMADQSDTRPGYGGQLLIYDGAQLRGRRAAGATPIVRLDLGGATAELASGHVVVFDAASRSPLSCLETTIGTTGTRQAHAAYPAPDGSYILVANQNGKRLERIDANYRTNTFTHNPAATLDLATCTTPSGQPCEHPDLRPINWPICPIVDSSSRYGFVTLRGGGMFVVDARRTPMAIVAEYDKATVHGNGCGGIEVGRHMYVNSGGSPVNVSSTDPHHPTLYGFDVYRFPLSGYLAQNAANSPAPTLLLSKGGMSDSHGVGVARGGRYLWAMDRHANVAEIIDLWSGQWVNTVALTSDLTDDPAPDLIDRSPAGDRLFVALRGSVPLSGDPHNATGSTPGLGIIEVSPSSRSGALVAIAPLTNPAQQAGQAPDAHGLRVRSTRGWK